MPQLGLIESMSGIQDRWFWLGLLPMKTEVQIKTTQNDWDAFPAPLKLTGITVEGKYADGEFQISTDSL